MSVIADLQALAQSLQKVDLKDPAAAIKSLLALAQDKKLIPASVQAAFTKLQTIQGQFADIKFIVVCLFRLISSHPL